MTEKDWQTGKGCCLDAMRGQLSPLGLVFNKVPINSPFISDRNQCSSDWVSQLTLSTVRRQRRRGGSKASVGGGDEIAEEITGSDSRGRAPASSSAALFLLMCGNPGGRRGGGVLWEQRQPPYLPHTLTEWGGRRASLGGLWLRRSWLSSSPLSEVCVTGWRWMWRRSGCLTPTPPSQPSTSSTGAALGTRQRSSSHRCLE